jgi:hypothetical protein
MASRITMKTIEKIYTKKYRYCFRFFILLRGETDIITKIRSYIYFMESRKAVFFGRTIVNFTKNFLLIIPALYL